MLSENLLQFFNNSFLITEDERNLYIGLTYFIQVYFIFIVFMFSLLVNNIARNPNLSDRRHYYILI